MTTKNYTSDSIKNLSFPHNVRHRPGMYIGSTDGDGVQTILREVLDNTVDECLEGHCSQVDVIIQGKDFTVIDNGRGIPRGKTEVVNQGDGSKTMVPTIRAVFGVLSTSGKFSDDAYRASRGCFTGDTEIKLLSGKTVTLEKLYKRWASNQELIPIMTFNRKTLKLEPSNISHVQLTKKVRDLVKVTLDNDQSVRCTPDHIFYVNRGGSIKGIRAENLREGDSLVSTYYKTDKDGYISQTEQGKKVFVHRLVGGAEDQLRVGIDEVHHINRRISDNRPSNLEILTRADHQRDHRLEKIESSRRRMLDDPELRLENSDRCLGQNGDPDFIKIANASKAIRVAARAIAQKGKLTEATYTAVRSRTEASWGKALKWHDSISSLDTSARILLAYYRSRVGISSIAERQLAEFSNNSRHINPVVNSQHANWIKSVKVWSDTLLSLEDPKNATPFEFNFHERKGSMVFGRYSVMRRHTTLNWLKEHILDGKELRLWDDLSEEAQAARMRQAEIKMRAPSSLRKMLKGFHNLLNKSGCALNEEAYMKAKAISNPNWKFSLDILNHLHGDVDLASWVSSFNHSVKSVTRIHLHNAVPVYDLTVDKTHVFFINPGILVKNSHGVGVKATNALSAGLKVSSFHTGKWLSIAFRKGVVHEDVSITPAPVHPITGKALTKGTLVKFRPDPEIFGDSNLSKVDLFNWAKMAAYFTPGFKINLYQIKTTGEVSERSFSFPEGPKQYVEDRIVDLGKTTEFGLLSEIYFHSTSTFHDCVIKFTSYDGCDARGFTNGLLNVEGGFHLTSLLNSLRESLTPYLTKKQNFTLNELKDGLVGCINIKMSGPKFDSQTKEKLVDERAAEPLKKILLAEFAAFFKKNKTLATSLCERATKLKDLKSKFVASKQMLTALKKISKKGFPAKAATSPKCKPHERELYLLEGDSAAGGGRFARDEYYQEFLPMKGKSPNVSRMKPGAEIVNEEILNIFAMLGFDPRQEDPYDKLRVGKIIIMSDSDADGSHISALLLGVFYKYLPALFEKGMIYVTRVPEYYAVHKNIVYSGNTREETQTSMDDAKVSAPINHLKGYGECPSDLLKIFAFEPTTRSLYRVNPCDDNKFELLMSEDSTSRKILLNI